MPTVPTSWVLHDILNQLGILWFNRTSYGRAFCYFKTAESMFLFSSEPGMRPTYIHTLFYLAQLYGHLNAPDKSATYCHMTLRHQLDDPNNNVPRDWVQNCLRLSEYFLQQNQLPKASQCLHACTCVGAPPDEQAQIAASLAKLYIQTLHLAQHKIDLLPDTDILFPTLRDATFIAPSAIDSFDAARDVFKKAMAALTTAKNFFGLDGFVTDHIRLLQCQSRCYAKLIPFEPDRKRQMAMHQKRIDVYDPILHGDFNLNAYGYLVQEIYFEVGEIYSVLHDLKVVVHWTKPYMETNQYAVDSIRFFEKFLQLYYYQQGKSDSLETLPARLYVPTHLDTHSVDDMKPFFNGVFFLTRVYGKVQFLDDAKTVLFWTKCLEMHECLLQWIPSLGLPNFFVDEIAISQEMSRLLPEKINHLHHKRRRL
ncbi:hypothetical protein, variant [Aphanomyces invadans]|uniref:KIF-binding protein n=1 Tax=Aphanomyces invadans TaxID=157072 RepID=A0A024TBD5_9STRA|nr:hypothetical protein, variant [Aphanomyces invadans]ETV91353.1 hypothetical protein, variant [Aphanomyces invadans]|eukprot:XP_008879981.1 hypothetical protein, variant [Aphanomyces invadans]